jgi:hypothetical protein
MGKFNITGLIGLVPLRQLLKQLAAIWMEKLDCQLTSRF